MKTRTVILLGVAGAAAVLLFGGKASAAITGGSAGAGGVSPGSPFRWKGKLGADGPLGRMQRDVGSVLERYL